MRAQEEQRDGGLAGAARGSVIVDERLVGKRERPSGRRCPGRESGGTPGCADRTGSFGRVRRSGRSGAAYPAAICPLAKACVRRCVAHRQVDGGAGNRPLRDPARGVGRGDPRPHRAERSGGGDRTLAGGLAAVQTITATLGGMSSDNAVERPSLAAATATRRCRAPPPTRPRAHRRARSRVVPRADRAQRHDLQHQHPRDQHSAHRRAPRCRQAPHDQRDGEPEQPQHRQQIAALEDWPLAREQRSVLGQVQAEQQTRREPQRRNR